MKKNLKTLLRINKDIEISIARDGMLTLSILKELMENILESEKEHLGYENNKMKEEIQNISEPEKNTDKLENKSRLIWMMRVN